MHRVKVTVTIDKSLVDWVDSEVVQRTFRNRSHGFEVALAKIKDAKRLP
jgi:Arc/MetJ-type ribon-helix-helix transcriptional regulator